MFLVEDDPLSLKALRIHLIESGFTVVGATDSGESCLAELQALASEGIEPDLMIVDIHLASQMDGISLAKILKERTSAGIVFATSDTDSLTFERACELQPHGFLIKPYNLTQTVATIEIALRQKKLEDELVTRRHELERLNANLESRVRERTQILADTLRFTQMLIDAIPIPLFHKDKDLVYRGCNKAFAQFHGLPKDKIIGVTAAELVDREMCDHYTHGELHLLDKGGEFSYETKIKHYDQTLHNVIFRKATYAKLNGELGGIIGTVFDITDTKRAEEELKLSEEKYRMLVERLPVIAYVGMINHTNSILYISPQAEPVLGYERDDFERNPNLWINSVHPEDQAFVREHIRATCETYEAEPFEFRMLAKDGSIVWFRDQSSIVNNDQGIPLFRQGMMVDITQHKKDSAQLELLTTALEAAANGVLITEPDGRIVWVNGAFTTLTGYSFDEVIGKTPKILNSGKNPPELVSTLWKTISSGKVWQGEFLNRRKNGTIYSEDNTITPVRDHNGKIKHFIAIKMDVTQRRQMESRLRQAQKLEAIGQLAAGIAHEINTPAHFVGDNLRFLEESFGDYHKLLQTYEELHQQIALEDSDNNSLDKINKTREDIDIDYLFAEIPMAIEQSRDGIRRIADIVRAMKDFSHPGSGETKLLNLNSALASTIIVARNEWKYIAEIETQFDNSLPPVPCLPGEINQTILNILVNAAHAISDRVKDDPDHKGIIIARTYQQDSKAVMEISDNGGGIPTEVENRIFDPFFTTKEVGRGTGQGLSIAYDMIVHKHGGELDFESIPNQGTTFFIRLPLARDDESNMISKNLVNNIIT